MNYLAHFLLSFGNEEYLTGQYIADDIKGKKYLEYPDGIRDGILLHRFVDHSTDTSPVTSSVRALIRPELGLFSPVAIDVFFDHMLARSWEKYSDETIEEFTTRTFASLLKYSRHMSPGMKLILDKMIEWKWLTRYQTVEGTSQTLREMAGRLKKSQQLAIAPQSLVNHYEIIADAFEIFFPQLISACEMKINTFAA